MEVVSPCPEESLWGLQEGQGQFEGISVKRGLGGRGRHASVLRYPFQGLHPMPNHSSDTKQASCQDFLLNNIRTSQAYAPLLSSLAVLSQKGIEHHLCRATGAPHPCRKDPCPVQCASIHLGPVRCPCCFRLPLKHELDGSQCCAPFTPNCVTSQKPRGKQPVLNRGPAPAFTSPLKQS